MAALVTRMVPPVAIGIPLASMMAAMGLSDTPIALSIAHTTISLPLSIWLMSSFFEAVPKDLEEAATVDGCSRLGALWRVVIPVVSGGIAVTAIFAGNRWALSSSMSQVTSIQRSGSSSKAFSASA